MAIQCAIDGSSELVVSVVSKCTSFCPSYEAFVAQHTNEFLCSNYILHRKRSEIIRNPRLSDVSGSCPMY